MSLTTFEVTVPVFVNKLTSVKNWLTKASAYADSKKFDVNNLLGERVVVDMFPFSRQVQFATDTAKLCVSRLTGVETPKYEDTEKTVGELIERIEKTIAYLQTFTPEKLEGTAKKTVSFTVRGQPVEMLGSAYIMNHAIPNFLFHVTTAYNLLRKNGLDIGKMDYHNPGFISVG